MYKNPHSCRRQHVSDLTLFLGDPEDAVEEFIALTDERITITYDGGDGGMDEDTVLDKV